MEHSKIDGCCCVVVVKLKIGEKIQEEKRFDLLYDKICKLIKFNGQVNWLQVRHLIFEALIH
jgi:hypothetical protein